MLQTLIHVISFSIDGHIFLHSCSILHSLPPLNVFFWPPLSVTWPMQAPHFHFPNLTSIFHCLCISKGSVQVRGFVKCFFMVRSHWNFPKLPIWKPYPSFATADVPCCGNRPITMMEQIYCLYYCL
jgi:hypothetical protein